MTFIWRRGLDSKLCASEELRPRTLNGASKAVESGLAVIVICGQGGLGAGVELPELAKLDGLGVAVAHTTSCRSWPPPAAGRHLLHLQVVANLHVGWWFCCRVGL